MSTKKPLLLIIPFLLLLGTGSIKSQLIVSTTQTPDQLVQNVLVGTGVSVSNVTFNSPASAFNIGEFMNGGGTNIGLSKGIIMASGNVNNAIGPNDQTGAGDATNTGTDIDLENLIPGYSINDAAVLEFDFIPLSDTIRFRYVFGSEEYPEFVNSNFNDVFGFFVDGPNPSGGFYVKENIALIPGTTLPVTIDNVNNVTPSFPQYYVDNTNGTTIQYDGFTVVLTASIVVIPCETYHIKLAIADAGDQILDSGVFLEANSFSSNAIVVNTEYTLANVSTIGSNATIEGCNNAKVTFTLLNPVTDSTWIPFDTIYGTAINGVDYPFVNDSVLILPGSNIGEIVISPLMDTINEPLEYVAIVVPTSACTKDTVIVPIANYTPITTVSSPDTTVCQGIAYLFTQPQGGAPPYDYTWSPQNHLSNPYSQNPMATPPGTMTYYVDIGDSTGCPHAMDSIKVTVDLLPLISFLPDMFKGCGPPLTVNFTDNCSPNVNDYIWQFGDGNVSYVSNPTHTYDSAGIYDVTLTVRTSTGCASTFTNPGLITVFQEPRIDILPDPPEGCTPLTVDFDFTTPDSISFFSWDFSDGSDTDSTKTPKHTFTQSGVYDVTLSAGTPDGCFKNFSYPVNVFVEPIAEFSTEPDSASLNMLPILFYDESTDAASWYWDFGDGSTSGQQNPKHGFPHTGDFDVLLVVTSIEGCIDSIVYTIPIFEDILNCPNIITPNGDGVNEKFVIENLEYYMVRKLFVYNRWGKKVYENINYMNDWDGSGLADGTYFFVLEYGGRINSGEFKGSLTILR
jgi:gliding motility-associated-like protein